jgi:hypothetical protein
VRLREGSPALSRPLLVDGVLVVAAGYGFPRHRMLRGAGGWLKVHAEGARACEVPLLAAVEAGEIHVRPLARGEWYLSDYLLFACGWEGSFGASASRVRRKPWKQFLVSGYANGTLGEVSRLQESLPVA